MTLRDIDSCPNPTCGAVNRYRVVDSRKRKAGYRRRVYRCRECDTEWPVFVSTIDPMRTTSDPRPPASTHT